MLRFALPCLALLCLAWLPPPIAPRPAAALQDGERFAGVTIGVERAAEGVWMLTGAGGNMALVAGPDGALLIDDQYPEMSARIQAAVAATVDQPLRYVFNTHWHGDHSGGNGNLSAAGATIVAHENVYVRLSTDQHMLAFDREVPAHPPAFWPTVTFEEGLNLHWGDDVLAAVHVPNAHTDGDSLYKLAGANVLHTGDTFFNGMYPFIDVGSGGSLAGILAANERALELTDESSAIIPGHGPLGTRADLLAFRDMIAAAQAAIAPLVEQGLERQAIIDAAPTAALDERWGGGFMQPDVWVGIVVDGMRR